MTETFFEPIQMHTVNILDNFPQSKDKLVSKIVARNQQFFQKQQNPNSQPQFWYQSFYPEQLSIVK
jgi:hypothetical protein